MSEDTTWAKRCRYAAQANILSVVLLAFVLIKSLITIMDSAEGDMSPSLVASGARYHLAFLFVAILTLLIRKRVTTQIQQALFGINIAMAVYMLFNTLQFWFSVTT